MKRFSKDFPIRRVEANESHGGSSGDELAEFADKFSRSLFDNVRECFVNIYLYRVFVESNCTWREEGAYQCTEAI